MAHLPVPDSRVACPCGRTGCLEATVSDTRFTRRAVGRATGLLLDVLHPDLLVVTETSSTLQPEYLEEIRAAAITHAHVRDDPDRIQIPHAGPAILVVAAATIALNPLFRSPLQAFADTAAMPASASAPP